MVTQNGNSTLSTDLEWKFLYGSFFFCKNARPPARMISFSLEARKQREYEIMRFKAEPFKPPADIELYVGMIVPPPEWFPSALTLKK